MSGKKQDSLPLTCLAVAFGLSVVRMYIVGFVSMVFGPYDLVWFSVAAFLLTIASIFFALFLIHPDYVPLSRRFPGLRFLRRIVGWSSVASIALTLATGLATAVLMGSATFVGGDTGVPLVEEESPYILGTESVSREHWLAASVSLAVAWHCFGASWIWPLLFVLLFETSPDDSGRSAHAE